MSFSNGIPIIEGPFLAAEFLRFGVVPEFEKIPVQNDLVNTILSYFIYWN